MRSWFIGVILLSVGMGVTRADEVSDLKAENSALTSENLALKAQIDALSRRLATMQGERAALDAKFDAVSRRLAGIEGGILNMQTTLAKQLQETIDRLAMLESGNVRPATSVANANTNSNTGSNSNINTKPAGTYVPPKSTNNYNLTKSDSNDAATNTTVASKDVARPSIEPPVIVPRVRVPRTRGGEGLPTTVAVVDMVEVFNNLREKAYVEESLADLIYAVQFQDKKWAEKVNAYTLDMQLLEKGSLAYLTKQHEIDQARIQWKVDIESAKAALNRKRGERIKELYNKMTDVCGRVADENGFDVILFKEPEPDYQNFRSVGDLAGSRMVLRANDSVDLTEQVIRVLNREFLTRRTGG